MEINLTFFSEISIRGRVAFSICCLRAILKHFKVEGDGWNLVIDKAWTYTSTSPLDDWHEEFAEYTPDVVLEFETYQEHDFKHLTEKMYDALKLSYENVNEDIKEVVELIFYIGTIELYGAVLKNGESLKYLEKLIRILSVNNLQLPDARLFLKYDISKRNGWGDLFSGEEVVCSE